jgi:cytoskeletal protein RodZ
MSRKNRKNAPAKSKPTRRRNRRKKKSKLFAAIVIELIAAVALFSAVRFAKDIRASQGPEQAQSTRTDPASSTRTWNQFAAASETAETSAPRPVFRISQLVGFAPGGS